MTLIAGFPHNGVPFLLGDILLSSVLRTTQPTNLPTIGRVDLPLGATRHITGLRQKVVLLNDNLVVGWAGPLSDAAPLLAGMQRKFATRPVTMEGIIEHLNLWDLVAKNVQLAIWFNNVDTGWIGHLGVNTLNVGEAMHLGGSGAPRMKALLDSRKMTMAFGGEQTPFGQSVGQALAYPCALIGEECLTGGGLADGYGGCVELAYYDGHKFKKLDDVIFLSWVAEVEDGCNVKLSMLPRLVKVGYHKDLLVVRVLDLGGAGTGPAGLEHYFITPPTRRAEPGEVERAVVPPFNSKFVASYVWIRGTDLALPVIDYQPEASRSAVLVDEAKDEILKTTVDFGTLATKVTIALRELGYTTTAVTT